METAARRRGGVWEGLYRIECLCAATPSTLPSRLRRRRCRAGAFLGERFSIYTFPLVVMFMGRLTRLNLDLGNKQFLLIFD